MGWPRKCKEWEWDGTQGSAGFKGVGEEKHKKDTEEKT